MFIKNLLKNIQTIFFDQMNYLLYVQRYKNTIWTHWGGMSKWNIMGRSGETVEGWCGEKRETEKKEGRGWRWGCWIAVMCHEQAGKPDISEKGKIVNSKWS